MQEKTRRTNAQRSDETRTALIKAARKLFISNGFADTSTPQIVKAAEVTRGALYHHFRDKADLFRAVLESEAKAVATQIAAADLPDSPLEAMLVGAKAYFAAMAKPGRAQLLLIEAPVALPPEDLARIERLNGGDELRLGLMALSEQGEPFPVDAMTTLLSALFDTGALAITRGASSKDISEAMERLIKGLAP